jgi:hypothetical protein
MSVIRFEALPGTKAFTQIGGQDAGILATT